MWHAMCTSDLKVNSFWPTAILYMMCSISQKTRELFLGKIFVSISRVTETYCGSYWKIKLSETKEATTEKKKKIRTIGVNV